MFITNTAGAHKEHNKNYKTTEEQTTSNTEYDTSTTKAVSRAIYEYEHF